MSSKIKILSRLDNQEFLKTKSHKVDLAEHVASDVSLNMNREDVFGFDRVGNDLIIELNNGEVETLKGFFEPNEDGKKNRLFFSENQEIEYIDLGNLEASGTLGVTQTAGAASLSANVPVAPAAIIFGSSAGAGGLGAGGIAALVGGTGAAAGGIAATTGSDDVVAISAPFGLSISADGSSISGQGEPGALIEVTDSTGAVIGTTSVGPDGTYNVVLSAPLADGETVSVRQGDGDGNFSPSVDATFNDTTPASDPTIDTVSSNDDGTVSVSGSGEPGATATVVFPDGSSVDVPVDENGNFGPVTSATPQSNGDIAVSVTDEAGNVSGTTVENFVDTGAPSGPVIDDVAANNDGTISVSGRGEPGATATVVFPDGTQASAPVNSDGTFGPVTSGSPQDSGDVAATQTDIAGNESPEAIQAYVDITAPSNPVIDEVAPNSDGTISVSGSGEPGSTVTVTLPDNTTVSGPVRPDGTFGPLTSSGPQSSGDVVVVATDEAGNTSGPVTDNFADNSAPDAPSDLVATSNPDGTLSVTGNGEPGSTVTVTFPDGTTTQTPVNPDGTFGPVSSTTAQPSGDVVATQTDPAGNSSPDTTEPFSDTVPPSPVNLVVTPNDDGTLSVTGMGEPGSTATVTFPDGTSATVDIDDDGNFGPVNSTDIQPSGDVVATQTDPQGNSSVPSLETYTDNNAPDAPTIDMVSPNSDGTLSVSGTGEPGAQVTLTFPDGSTATTTVQPDGSYGPVTSTTPQTNGDIVASQVDPAGNSSPDVVADYVDTTAPTEPVITTVEPNSDGTLGVSGTGEPGSTVTVSFPDGTTGTALIDDNGNFGPIQSSSPQTTGDVSASQTDMAGNTSPSNTVPYMDSTSPLAPVIDDISVNSDGTVGVSGTGEPGSTATVTFPDGTIASGPVRPDGTFGPLNSSAPQTGDTFTASQTDEAGNISPDTTAVSDVMPPAAPMLDPTNGSPVTGTAEPGSTVTITDDMGNVIGTGMADAMGNFSIVPSPVPADGDVISATATDAAGNTSPATDETVDASAPAAPTLDPTDGSTITGSAEPGATGSTITGSAEPGATVTITDDMGNVIGTGVADPTTGAFSIVPSPVPADGDVISATATDAAGNTSPTTDETVDSDAASAPMIDPTDGSQITGTAEPGSTVTVTDDMGNVRRQPMVMSSPQRLRIMRVTLPLRQRKPWMRQHRQRQCLIRRMAIRSQVQPSLEPLLPLLMVWVM